MNRQTLLWTLVCMVVVVGAYFVRQKKLQARHYLDDSIRQVRPELDWEDVDRRVEFVCCDNQGAYSPIIYSRCGGGMAAFDTIVQAAPFMRAGDQGSAAAGLCGFLFRQTNYPGDTGGTLSVDPPPQREADGNVNWAKIGGNCDVFVINVDTASAKCCCGTVLGREIHDLPLGGATKHR